MTTESKELLGVVGLVIATNLIQVKTLRAKYVDQMPARSALPAVAEIIGVVRKGSTIILRTDDKLYRMAYVDFFFGLTERFALERKLEYKEAQAAAQQEFDRIPQLFED